MRKIFLLIPLVLLFLDTRAQINNYEIGDTVNDFSVVDVYGNLHNLYTYTAQGKYVFIDFFYAACGGCQNFVPVFNEFYDKYGCNEGEVVCIAINSGEDNNQTVIEFENTYGGTFNHAPAVSRDGGSNDVNVDFDPIYYPACVIIGPDNTVVNDNVNPIDVLADLEAAFPVGFDPQPMACSLSIDDLSSEPMFSIFPNPSNGRELSLKTYKVTNATISIFNVLGEKVFHKELNGNIEQIFPNLNPGSFFVKLQTSSGNRTYKLLVQ